MKSCTQLCFTDSGTIPEQCGFQHPHRPERCDGVTPLCKRKGSNGIPGLSAPACSIKIVYVLANVITQQCSKKQGHLEGNIFHV